MPSGPIQECPNEAPLNPRTALLFAGQATQYVGMGRALHDSFPEARAVFALADEALSAPLSRLIFEGPDEELTRTENTQPAVLTVACAALAVLSARGFRPAVVAGHSVGEYGALVAAGALDFADAVRLTRRRGQLMQSTIEPGEGAMAAIQRVDDEVISSACLAADGLCQIAAFNAPGVTVISGRTASVLAASATLDALGAIVTPLPVSAPFHSAVLEPAAVGLREELCRVPISALKCPYIANVDAAWLEVSTPDEVRDRLVQQVVSAVRWRQSLELMISRGITRFWHLGPGRSNLTHVKRLDRKANVASLDEPSDVKQILAELEACA